MSFRSFHCRTLTDLKPPCNTPQLSSHGDKLSEYLYRMPQNKQKTIMNNTIKPLSEHLLASFIYIFFTVLSCVNILSEVKLIIYNKCKYRLRFRQSSFIVKIIISES